MAAGIRQDSKNAMKSESKPVEIDVRHSESSQIYPIHGQTVEALKDVAYGSTAGILGKYVEYPFDTVKVRLQSQSNHPHNTQPLRGPLEAFAQAWQAPEGPIKNLYRGVSAPLVGAAVETSSLFFSYRAAQDLLVAIVPSLGSNGVHQNRTNLPFSALLLCGAASGAFTSVLLTPIELIKCKMQIPLATVLPEGQRQTLSLAGHPIQRLPNPLQLIVQIFRSQGLRGFWHGQLGTLIRETGGSAAWFGSYEGVKTLLDRQTNATGNVSSVMRNNAESSISTSSSSSSVPAQLLAGATAGISYNFFFYPADTVKSRMQTTTITTTINAPSSIRSQLRHPLSSSSGSSSSVRERDPNDTQKSATFLKTARKLYQESGIRGFYRGCGITVFRAAPSSAIIFGIYEWLRGRFG